MIDVSDFIDWPRGKGWNSPNSKYHYGVGSMREDRYTNREFLPHICDKDNKENAITMKEKYAIPSIKKVIYNPPATIVCWGDDTKTVVKCCEADIYDTEKGFAMAVIKKLCGNESAPFHKLFKTWAADDKILTTSIEDDPLFRRLTLGTILHNKLMVDSLKESFNRAFGIGGIDGD